MGLLGSITMDDYVPLSEATLPGPSSYKTAFQFVLWP